MLAQQKGLTHVVRVCFTIGKLALFIALVFFPVVVMGSTVAVVALLSIAAFACEWVEGVGRVGEPWAFE